MSQGPLWEEASASVTNLARILIEKHHRHLERAKVGFVFRREAMKQAGMMVYGAVSKITEKEKVYVDLDFLIWISKEDWESRPAEWCEALLDHELCHCAGADGFGWRLRPHDVQEFVDVVKRHGFWNQGLFAVQRAAEPEPQQLEVEEMKPPSNGGVFPVDPQVMKKIKEINPNIEKVEVSHV